MSLIYFGSPAKPLLQAEPPPSPKSLIFTIMTPLLLPRGQATGRVAQEIDTISLSLKPWFSVFCFYSVWDIGSYQGGTALGSVLQVAVTIPQGDVYLRSPLLALTSRGPSAPSQALMCRGTHRPVHTGHRASGKEAGHSTGHIDVIT